MQLKHYLKTLVAEGKQPGALEDFAERCGTSVGQMQHVARGHRRAGESLAINIERESGGVVRCETLRPDVDWAYLRGSQIEGSSQAA